MIRVTITFDRRFTTIVPNSLLVEILGGRWFRRTCLTDESSHVTLNTSVCRGEIVGSEERSKNVGGWGRVTLRTKLAKKRRRNCLDNSYRFLTYRSSFTDRWHNVYIDPTQLRDLVRHTESPSSRTDV